MARLAGVLISGAVACFAAAGCRADAQAPPAVCSAPQDAAAAQALASSDAAFAVALFQPAVVAAGAGQNAILSPYSVSATLKMVDVGAAGETDAQIQSVLHLSGNGTAIAPAYAALACEDETDGSESGNTLSIANSVWAQQAMPFVPGFLSTLSTGYDAPLQQVDFEGDPTAATSSINAWVSTSTQGQIPSLLTPGAVNQSTRLVLVNAVYFKGAWQTAFDPSRTQPQPFTLSDGTVVSVPTMNGIVSLKAGSSGGSQITELGYQGGGMAMDFVVPQGTLSDMVAGLTPAVLQALVGSLGPSQYDVQLLLPKFSFDTTLALAPILGGLGMPDLFDPTKANLSGMDGAMDLYVGFVAHEAIIEVDESGTVAAAASGGGVQGGAVEAPTAIDRPFLFLIRDVKNGSILFMGQVEDPRQN